MGEMFQIRQVIHIIIGKGKQKGKGVSGKYRNIRNGMVMICHFDLNDMQSQGDGDINMIYNDALTKFIQLRMLKTKRQMAVAYDLLYGFTMYGALCIT